MAKARTLPQRCRGREKAGGVAVMRPPLPSQRHHTRTPVYLTRASCYLSPATPAPPAPPVPVLLHELPEPSAEPAPRIAPRPAVRPPRLIRQETVPPAPEPPSPPLPLTPLRVNRDMTVRAGSSSTCWLSISAKLRVIQISSHRAQEAGEHYASSAALPIRLLTTMAWKRPPDNMHSPPKLSKFATCEIDFRILSWRRALRGSPCRL